KVRLSNGLTVKLIGIKSDPFTHDKAVGYLNEKIKGKRIFLKYDKLKHDEENLLLCYLYLENKTFVNAHLIKSGLVGIDCSYEYKQKVKFLEMGEVVS
ncbi:MAG: thermonuclease family protein, partial [Chlorobium sp.]